MEDGTTVPIVRRRLSRADSLAPLPPIAPDETPSRSSPKIRVVRKTTLPPEAHTWVTVCCDRRGLQVIQPDPEIYGKHSIAIANGVVQVEPERPFRILVANFAQHEQRLHKSQVIGTVLPHPTAIFPTEVSLGEVLGLVDEIGVVQTDPPPATIRDPPSPKVENIDLSHVPTRLQERIREMLRPFSSMWDGSLCEIRTTEHRINLQPDARPIAQNPYRAGPRARVVEQEEVDRMLQAGVIEPAQSEWASPVVLVPKSDGTLRFCVDYRRLNAVTIKDSYPLPRMDECIDSLGDANVFSTLDCNSGYWQVPVREEDRDKTAFTCHSGLYRYK